MAILNLNNLISNDQRLFGKEFREDKRGQELEIPFSNGASALTKIYSKDTIEQVFLNTKRWRIAKPIPVVDIRQIAICSGAIFDQRNDESTSRTIKNFKILWLIAKLTRAYQNLEPTEAVSNETAVFTVFVINVSLSLFNLLHCLI